MNWKCELVMDLAPGASQADIILKINELLGSLRGAGLLAN